MKTKSKKISLTLKRLLLDEDLSTGEVVEARKAESAGLIKIHRYCGDQGESTTCPEKYSYLYCDYSLTVEGLKLQRKLLSGDVKAQAEKTDQHLIALINHTISLLNETEPEDELNTESLTKELAGLARDWIDKAKRRLGIPTDTPTIIYRGDRAFGMCLAEVMTQYKGTRLRFSLILNARSMRGPVTVTVELEAREAARYAFRQVLEDYPRALASLLKYGGAIRFYCHVGFDNEPKHSTPDIERMKVYFAADSDPEEHFWLEFEAGSHTITQTIYNAMTCLLALHIASGTGNISEAILKYHLVVQNRKHPKTRQQIAQHVQP